MRAYKNLPFYCYLCGKEFRTLQDLNEHECKEKKEKPKTKGYPMDLL